MVKLKISCLFDQNSNSHAFSCRHNLFLDIKKAHQRKLEYCPCRGQFPMISDSTEMCFIKQKSQQTIIDQKLSKANATFRYINR